MADDDGNAVISIVSGHFFCHIYPSTLHFIETSTLANPARLMYTKLCGAQGSEPCRNQSRVCIRVVDVRRYHDPYHSTYMNHGHYDVHYMVYVSCYIPVYNYILIHISECQERFSEILLHCIGKNFE